MITLFCINVNEKEYNTVNGNEKINSENVLGFCNDLAVTTSKILHQYLNYVLKKKKI